MLQAPLDPPEDYYDECDDCDDTGKVRCEGCGGSGELVDHGDDLHECYDCDGTGEVDCDDCPRCPGCLSLMRDGGHGNCDHREERDYDRDDY